eukprot:553395_1
MIDLYKTQPIYQLLSNTFASTIAIIVITIVGMIDGLQISLRIKGVLCLMLALIYTVQTFVWTLYWESKYPYSICIFGDVEINIASWITSSNRIISIFGWKQFISLIKNKGKATTINEYAIIEWIN